VLEVKELKVFRGRALIVRDLSLSIGAGEVVHLKGKNGSGKSTTLEAIAGLIPYQGKVNFESINFCNPEEFLYDDLTVEENLRLFLGDLPKLSFGVEELLKRRVGALSRGEKARVSIVRAISSNAKVLLFDEITSPLDNDYKREFYVFLQGFPGACLITSHEELPSTRAITLEGQT
jgi:ABC-type multidrug transport system ATPase subunit